MKQIWERAYAVGYEAGIAWDLSHFCSIEAVKRSTSGWLEGIDPAFKKSVGLSGAPTNSAAVREAAAAFEAGAYAGACAPLGERTGCAPGTEEWAND